MLNIHVNDDCLFIKNIDKTSIKKIYSIYTNSNDFKYATGIFQPIGYEQFANNICQFINRENVFFLHVRLHSGETIGLVKGTVINNSKLVWINSMVIDTPYQGKGYGKRVMCLLEEYFRSGSIAARIYLSVFKPNTVGVNFWRKCGFTDCNQFPDRKTVKYNDTVQIMFKLL